jgi:hypothetical protein
MYILSTGTAVVSELFHDTLYSGVKFTNNEKEAVTYERIGDAMKAAEEVNHILGNERCKAIYTE